MKISRRRERRDRELLHGAALALARDRRRHDDHGEELQDEADHARHDEVLALQVGVEAELRLELDRAPPAQAVLDACAPCRRAAAGWRPRTGSAARSSWPSSPSTDGAVKVSEPSTTRRTVPLRPSSRAPLRPVRQDDEGADAVVQQVVLGLRDVGLGRVLAHLGLEGRRLADRLDVLVRDAAAVEVEHARADAGDARVADRVAEDHGQDRRHEDQEGERAPVAHEVQELLRARGGRCSRSCRRRRRVARS